ncbi:DUF4258 domain-containing protein [Luteibacter anthropi]|uniref:DUF4258 domain-containing protein n=1 Tax=Luteibacter anthropi TaxID=564369 RepID=A0A7X5UDK4_9GAMM|nr:DUF4258 domain-containing protein [Luteibacter anthropi]NII08535.1 DUF4258 domain-containing protein [Luteibacter anthropi]URX63082.1 DUF4258 domain-containing protein [Luteibacter anthropi]
MPKPSVAPFRMSDATALKHLRAIADEPSRVRYTMHARDRMTERSILPEHAYRCLQRGSITESPTLDFHGNWQLRVEHYMAGHTLACAVAIDIRRPQAIVITAFWVN